jgi:hypothetical protein
LLFLLIKDIKEKILGDPLPAYGWGWSPLPTAPTPGNVRPFRAVRCTARRRPFWRAGFTTCAVQVVDVRGRSWEIPKILIDIDRPFLQVWNSEGPWDFGTYMTLRISATKFTLNDDCFVPGCRWKKKLSSRNRRRIPWNDTNHRMK